MHIKLGTRPSKLALKQIDEIRDKLPGISFKIVTIETAGDKDKVTPLVQRENSDFFKGRCTIYLVQLLEFDGFPKLRAMMLNYKSVAGDPRMPFIRCSIPSSESDTCRIFDWKDSRPQIDGVHEQLFIEFGE